MGESIIPLPFIHRRNLSPIGAVPFYETKVGQDIYVWTDEGHMFTEEQFEELKSLMRERSPEETERLYNSHWVGPDDDGKDVLEDSDSYREDLG